MMNRDEVREDLASLTQDYAETLVLCLAGFFSSIIILSACLVGVCFVAVYCAFCSIVDRVSRALAFLRNKK